MYLSISIDVATAQKATAAYEDLLARADRIEAAAADIVLLAREMGAGVLAPSRIEAVVTMPWLAGRLRTPVVVVGIPALHSVPFHIARALSAADFLSNGRTGWMPLASGRERYDAAYGRAHAIDAADAGAKYDDFIRATQVLWDSWDDDALIVDQASGAYLDSKKVRRVDYRGRFFATMGPLNSARPPQGYPLLVRDLSDMADSSVAADILLGDRAQFAAIGTTNAIRLLKADAAAVDVGVEAVQAGAADGLHLAGSDALETLEALRLRYPAQARHGATARERLGREKPTNPYSGKVAA